MVLQGHIWRELWDLGYGITNLNLFVMKEDRIYSSCNCSGLELVNSADCVVSLKLIMTVWYLTRLSLHDDHPNLWRPSVSSRANHKTNQNHLLTFGGRNNGGSCLPPFPSLLFSTLNPTQNPRQIWGKDTHEQPIVIHRLVFCWHAKGIPSTFVSLSSQKTELSTDRQKLFCTTG